MSISEPFVLRPVATTLLAAGLLLTGLVAYLFLPVANLPNVEFPTINVSAGRPGADPETMAATVAAPLERRLAAIAGVTEITSRSSLGSTTITIQFDIDRDIDGAARDVQAALNSAMADLPGDLPNRPSFRKVNPSATPMLILAMTARTRPPGDVYDAAETVVAQRIAQVAGVGDVNVSGAEQPAIRVRVDPARAAAMGLGLEQIRMAIVAANTAGPLGTFDGPSQLGTIATTGQLTTPDEYRNLIVRAQNGSVVRLSAIATVEEGVRNSRQAGWLNDRPAVLLSIFKQADANIIETVARIHALLPELRRWIPADIEIIVLSDRTTTIRASIEHLQSTLGISIALVMVVVFLFLRRATPTIAAGITVPLSLAGTFAAMWAVGYSLDNLSLMALIISVGFVVDDAIVMIENCYRNIEQGMSPLQAAIEGARQIGFTVVSISVSLVAVFIPLLFMGGIVGRIFREFAMTLTFAIAISAVVSLTVTPMICGRFIRRDSLLRRTLLDRIVDPVFALMLRGYERGLRWSIQRHAAMLLATAATIAGTVWLYVQVPKGWFPQDDSGLLFVGTRASPDVSFETMAELQRRAADIINADPAIAGLASFVGASGWNGSVNQGRMFVTLKPPEERNVSAAEVIDRLRRPLAMLPGIQVFMFPAQDVRVGGRQSNSEYLVTVWGPNLEEVLQWAPRVLERMRAVPGVLDVNADRQQGGLQVNVVIDRAAAARLGVRVVDIDAALNNAFGQRQITTIYGQRNQYRVVLEVEPRYQRDPSSLQRIYVTATDGTQVPLAAVARIERALVPLSVYHQGQFPAVTVSFNVAPGVALSDATSRVDQAVAELQVPGSVRVDYAGNAAAFRRGLNSTPLLILAALLTIYIVLGVLYESLVHPITIISTLPAAGLGALLALYVTGTELTLIAMIGILLLMGIVKKNGIILVDFALDAERTRGLTPERAMYEACIARFRPIMMTTMAAICGALPLALGTGTGAEIRRPLGLTIIGGLVVSQMLTLFTTPAIYLLLEHLRARVVRVPAPAPAE